MKRSKDGLIPFKEQKRVIHIEKRGKDRMRLSKVSLICMLLGTCCVLYCLFIFLFMGFGTWFFLIWGFMGGCLLLLGWLIAHKDLLGRIPRWIKIGTCSVAAAGLLVFLVVEGMIVSRFAAKAPKGADYCIVLGAQMKEHGPSDVLRRRLDTAIRYLKQNPDTVVIVSGGQGANEPVTEASGMYEYLVEKGIAGERILKEDVSGNTVENLLFSSELLNREEDVVVLVTNNFHVFRAEEIAKKLGYEKVHGLAADSYPLMVPNNMLREFLGVVKDFLIGG